MSGLPYATALLLMHALNRPMDAIADWLLFALGTLPQSFYEGADWETFALVLG
jgi:hypothetical protein